jgi:hypothetical protein
MFVIMTLAFKYLKIQDYIFSIIYTQIHNVYSSVVFGYTLVPNLRIKIYISEKFSAKNGVS